MARRPSSTSRGQAPPLLHLQLPIPAQRPRVAAAGEPGLRRGVALEVGVPEGGGALEDQILDARVLLSPAGPPPWDGEGHVVAALKDDEVLIGGVDAVEGDAPLRGL